MSEKDYPITPRRGLSATRDTSVAYTLAQRLCAELPERTSALRLAYHARPPDLDAVAAEAHRLAGSAAYCGQEPLARAARRLEHVAHSGPWPRIESAWRLLTHEVSALMANRQD